MTYSIDHTAEAVRLAEIADTSYGRIEHRNGSGGVSEGVEALLAAQVAQVHATLALVEQQRIANQIAYLEIASVHRGGYDDSTQALERRVQGWLGLS